MNESKLICKPLPRVEQVIISNEGRGLGVTNDPVRNVIIITDLDGTFIAEYDSCKDK